MDEAYYAEVCCCPDHPGYGLTFLECQRKVRRLEQAGGVGQWFQTVRLEHHNQLDGLVCDCLDGDP
jgi:hypothetical protein